MTSATITVPEELRRLRRFVIWKYELRNGKRTKPPYQPNGRYADSTNPDTWVSYDEAIAAASRFDGIGFVVTDADPYVVFDLDHCVDAETREMEPWARDIVDAVNSITEITPSGEGCASSSADRFRLADGALDTSRSTTALAT